MRCCDRCQKDGADPAELGVVGHDNTTKAPRYLTFHPREKLELLQAARQYQQTQSFKERYKKRAGIEAKLPLR